MTHTQPADSSKRRKDLISKRGKSSCLLLVNFIELPMSRERMNEMEKYILSKFENIEIKNDTRIAYNRNRIQQRS